ncbi:hypothetical protein EMCRGX_G018285 [Ephydatia muelleri]
MLGLWALALQEYSFTVPYCRGSQNTNADALSRRRDPSRTTLPAAVTGVDIQMPLPCILAAQKQNQVIKHVAQALQSSSCPTTIKWWKPPFRRPSRCTEDPLLTETCRILGQPGTDVERHCKECTVCQQTKPTMSTRVQMTNVPIGRPWQMIAVDILDNNRYLLVVQDYFTKWADARPLPDQTASRITTELMDLFTTYGIP